MPFSYSQLESMPIPGKVETPAMKGGLGLYLRRYPTGDHQWYWRGEVKKINGQPPPKVKSPWVHIGALSDARLTVAFLQAEAVRFKGLARKGINPNDVVIAPPAPILPTLQDVWNRFCAEFLPTRSAAYAEGQKAAWKRHVVGEGNVEVAKANFPAIPLDQVNTATCKAILKPLIAAEYYTTANRLRSTISKLCTWCRGEYPLVLKDQPNWIAGSPKQDEFPEDRSLSESELKLFAKGYKASTALHKHTILWLLLTGCRGGLLEAFNPGWQNGNFLLIPIGTKRVKKARFVVMPNAAMRLIPHMQFPVTVAALRHALDDIADKGGIRGKCSPRTLRKTFSSLAADWDELESSIDFALNHKGSRIRQAYLLRTVKPLLPMVERTATRMLKIMGIRVR